MGSRPLRQQYDEANRYVVDDALGDVVTPWRGHRARLLDTVRSFDEAQWRAPTHCAGWDARDVISHLVTVDRFFASSLQAAQAGEPTRILPGFDPKAIPEMLVAPMREVTTDEILDQFAAGQQALRVTVEAFAPDDWRQPAESPFGHVPALLVLAHAFWDSWIHERDILEPAGAAPAPDGDEAFTAGWYSLLFGCAQGGLLGDDRGLDGPGGPIDAELVFAERPDRSVRARVDERVRLDAGSAVDGLARRGGASLAAVPQLPPALRAQLERGQQTF